MDELFESLLTRGRREQCAEEVNDMFKQGFVPLYGLLKPASNFNWCRRIQIFLNFKERKKKEEENPNIPMSFQGLVFLQASLN